MAGKYVSGDHIAASLPKVVGTAGSTPGELDWQVQLAEDWLDGRIGRFYNTATFSGNAPPIVRTITRLRSQATYLQTLFTMEDPSISEWVQSMLDQANELTTELVSGTIAMVTDSGTIIAPALPLASRIWSDKMQYVPTFNLRDPIHQRIDPERLDDEARDQDSKGIDGLS